nr:zinc finger, CCHC-type [Tanacetum cinerariifolium]
DMLCSRVAMNTNNGKWNTLHESYENDDDDDEESGYPKETMRYSFYNPSENKLFVARNAEFFESKLLDLKASGSVEDLELIQEEDTNPSVDTGLDREEDDQEIDEPQSTLAENLVRGSWFSIWGRLTRELEFYMFNCMLNVIFVLRIHELKAMYSKQAEQELLQTVREFHTCKQAEGQSVSSHVLKMKGYIDNLERLGQPVGKNLAVSLILVSLNKDFDSFVQNYNMHDMGKTVNELHVMLKLHEESLPKKDANTALHAIRAGRVQKNQKNKPHKAAKGGHGKGKGKMGNASFSSKPKTPPPPKKDNPAKDAICHQCDEVGHWRRNCPVYLAELMKKKKLSHGASTSGIFTIELYSFPSKSWIYDTGCAIEAIGTYHLELPSGLVIVLNNFHYAPSITRGVISVSWLFDDGFVNRFDENNVISVSKNNLVYFMDVPRDDSFLLWHCRLGHISKKRIEKLQHDGLLNSIDIESLGKCVSCMSGKLARKSYSHQVERAKDLIGLTYTD